MAEGQQQGNGFSRFFSRVNPFTRIRDNASAGIQEWRDHPIQEGLQRLLGFGAGAVTANPAVGAAAGAGADKFFNWWNNRQNNDFGPAGGYPGITSPNQANNANPQSNLMQMLGIPNYGAGNPGSTGANSFLTGNFSPSQMQGSSPSGEASGPLVDLNYGQNPQQYQMEGGGTPGITGPNIYAGSAPPPSMYSGQTGAASTLAGAGRGQTVGTMSMGQLGEMLSAGIGQNNRAAMMTPGREVNLSIGKH